MSEQLTIVFFLWRNERLSTESYAEFYNDNHQELVAKTVTPPPFLFERSFPLDDPVIGSCNRSSVLSFDSFTAATFARRADFDRWGTILADPVTSKMLEENEAEFTRPECRIQLAAEPVRSGAMEPVNGPDAVCLLHLVTAAEGVDRTAFKAAHEAVIAAEARMERSLRRVRYYPEPNHPLSYARRAWMAEAKTRFQLIEHLTFRDMRAARRGFEAMRQPIERSGHIGSETIVQVRQVLRPPTAWRSQ